MKQLTEHMRFRFTRMPLWEIRDLLQNWYVPELFRWPWFRYLCRKDTTQSFPLFEITSISIFTIMVLLVTATYACGKRDHMCITFLKDKLSLNGQHRMNIITETLTLIFAACIMVCGADIAFYSLCNIAEDIQSLKARKGGQ